MATAIHTGTPLKTLEAQLTQMANAQFESDAFKRLLGLRFNKERARMYIIQRTHWTVNRRDCWAAVQSLAPLPVKKVIWDHERDELEGDKDLGKPDHYTMSVQEGASVGLKGKDFIDIGLSDGAFTCCSAWLHLARTSHWLSGIAASSALELSNSDEILNGGGMSHRMAYKMRDEVGIPFKKQASNVEHMAADVKHAHLLMQVAEQYAVSDTEIQLILEGARQSWQIDRIWKGHLADLLAAIPD